MIKAKKVFDEVFSARNFNSSPLTISDLQGDLYDYELIIVGIGSSGNPDMTIRANADSGSNYRYYNMRGTTSTANAAVEDSGTSILIPNGWGSNKIAFTKINITGSSGDERYFNIDIAGTSGSSTRVTKNSSYWKNTADEIASIVIASSSSQNHDAHIMLYSTPKASGQSSWELLETTSFTSVNVNSTFTGFTGLSLDAASEYRVDFNFTDTSSLLTFRFNGDDTAANYATQEMRNLSGGISALNRNGTSRGLFLNASSPSTAVQGSMYVSGESGSERIARISHSKEGGAFQQIEIGGWWTNTVDDLDEIELNTSNNSSSSTTGTLKLYKKRNPAGTGDTLPFEVIHSKGLSATDYSAGETINILGDSINLLKVEGLLSNASGDIEIRMQLNSDTASNYPEQLLKGDTSSASAASATRAYIVLAKLQNGDQSEFTTYLYPKSGENRPALTRCSYDENAIEFLGQWWSNSADEVTTAKIYASSSNGVTGKLILSRLVSATQGSLQDTLLLKGSSQNVNLGQDSTLTLDDGDKSHSIWFKTSSASTQMIFNQGDASVGPYYDIYIASGQIVARAWDASVTRSYKTNALTFADGSFHNLIIRWNSFGTFDIIVDGVTEAVTIVDTGTLGTVGNASKDLDIGVRGDTTSLYFSGSIALPMMFDATITAGDVAELQTAKNPEKYSTGLKAKYAFALPLNDSVADPETDRSANGNDGTLVGSPTYTGTQLKIYR